MFFHNLGMWCHLDSNTPPLDVYITDKDIYLYLYHSISISISIYIYISVCVCAQ